MVGVQVKPNLDKCFPLTEDVEITVRDRENKRGDSLEISMQILEVSDPEDEDLYGLRFLRVSVNTIAGNHKLKKQTKVQWTTGRLEDLWGPVVAHHMHIARRIAGLKHWDVDLNVIWAANKPKLEIQDLGCAPPTDTHYLDLLMSISPEIIIKSKIAAHDPEATPPGTKGYSENCTLGPLPRKKETAKEEDDGMVRRKRPRLGRLVGMGPGRSTIGRGTRGDE